jgi:hypothetical protein
MSRSARIRCGRDLNGTLLDGEAIQPFQPEPLDQGQALTLGQVVLTVSRLPNEAA